MRSLAGLGLPPPVPRDDGVAAAGASEGASAPLEAVPLPTDRVIHERTRLGILGALAVNAQLTFADLKALLEVTDGNLSVHARKLEDAGYLTCTKTFVGRVPRTEFRLTQAGRGALTDYLDQMERLIQRARGGPSGAERAAPVRSARDGERRC